MDLGGCDGAAGGGHGSAGVPLPQPRPGATAGHRDGLPRRLSAFVLQVSGRHQLGLVLLSALVFTLSAVPLEIQRRVVNGVVQQGRLAPVVWLALAYLGVALLQGGIKLGMNVYRSWVSEHAVLVLRRRVSALVAPPAGQGRPIHAEGAEVSMMLSEVEPIGGFVGISVSEPLLQAGILASVFGYLAYLQPVVAVLCALAFVPQMVFVPVLQKAINRRAAERVQTLRDMGDDMVDGRLNGTSAGMPRQDSVARVFRLDMGMLRTKYTMYFLMNLMHHLSVALALGVGGYYVVHGRLDVGTVVAFISGLVRVNDPWGDMVDWYREMTQVRTRYRLLQERLEVLGPDA